MSKEGETRDEVFGFIIRYKIAHQGNTPSLEEISDGCGLSGKSHAKHHVDNLEDDGRITRTGRNIEVPGAVWMIPNAREIERE